MRIQLSLLGITALVAGLVASGVGATASAQEQKAEQKMAGKTGEHEMTDEKGPSAKTKSPYAKPDGTWISLSGTVKDVKPDRFTLDYGKGLVTVEMDDGDRDADAYKLLAGDKVTVSGRIDDDFYEMTKIEASSVFVEKLGTYFYASPIDEEDVFFYTLATPIVVASTVVRGTVTSVSGDEFVIDTGVRSLRVEVDELGYDPLDHEGYQRIGVGDYVKVTGTMDSDFFEGRELVADTVIKIAG